jgi:hypothetical protein
MYLWADRVDERSEVITSPLPSVPGCIPSRFDSQKLMIVFAAIVASQFSAFTQPFSACNGDPSYAVMMLISSWIGIRKYKHSNSPILVVFYRDGFFYFLSLTSEYSHHPVQLMS